MIAVTDTPISSIHVYVLYSIYAYDIYNDTPTALDIFKVHFSTAFQVLYTSTCLPCDSLISRHCFVEEMVAPEAEIMEGIYSMRMARGS